MSSGVLTGECGESGAARLRTKAGLAMKRPAYADEIASVIAFLCSDDSRWVSGINLPIDGGLASTFI